MLPDAYATAMETILNYYGNNLGYDMINSPQMEWVNEYTVLIYFRAVELDDLKEYRAQCDLDNRISALDAHIPPNYKSQNLICEPIVGEKGRAEIRLTYKF